jgi:hypothetical protein
MAGAGGSEDAGRVVALFCSTSVGWRCTGVPSHWAREAVFADHGRGDGGPAMKKSLGKPIKDRDNRSETSGLATNT